jgi:hypothetical protein
MRYKGGGMQLIAKNRVLSWIAGVNDVRLVIVETCSGPEEHTLAFLARCMFQQTTVPNRVYTCLGLKGSDYLA